MLTRIPWRLIGGAVVIALAAITVLSFISDPFGIRAWFQERLETRAATAERDASARGLEVEGSALCQPGLTPTTPKSSRSGT